MTSPLSAAAQSSFSAELPTDRPNPGDAAEDAAKKFEQMLLFELLKTMRKTALQDDSNGGFAQDTVMGMFDQALADSAAGNLGIAPMLSRQLGGGASVAVPSSPSPSAIAPRPDVEVHRHAPSPPLDPRPSSGVLGGATPRAGDLPVEGRRSSGYGWRVHPVSGDKKFHTGLDIAAPQGTEIRAPAAGKVVFAGRHRGYGNMVEILHEDGAKTRYAHASRLHVKVGDRVDVGEAIADVGSTGVSTGPHVHFEVRRHGHALDPDRYLQRLRDAEGDPDAATRPRSGVIDDRG